MTGERQILDPQLFPGAKLLDDGRVAYCMELTGGRGRINLTTLDDLMFVDDFF